MEKNSSFESLSNRFMASSKSPFHDEIFFAVISVLSLGSSSMDVDESFVILRGLVPADRDVELRFSVFVKTELVLTTSFSAAAKFSAEFHRPSPDVVVATSLVCDRDAISLVSVAV